MTARPASYGPDEPSRGGVDVSAEGHTPTATRSKLEAARYARPPSSLRTGYPGGVENLEFRRRVHLPPLCSWGAGESCRAGKCPPPPDPPPLPLPAFQHAPVPRALPPPAPPARPQT